MSFKEERANDERGNQQMPKTKKKHSGKAKEGRQGQQHPVVKDSEKKRKRMTDHKTQDEPQWIVAQRLLSALTIPGFK